MADKMTAVEWLLNEMNASDWYDLPKSMKQDIIDQAKEMEREQKQQAYDDGADDACEMFYQMSKS